MVISLRSVWLVFEPQLYVGFPWYGQLIASTFFRLISALRLGLAILSRPTAFMDLMCMSQYCNYQSMSLPEIRI